MDKNSLQYQLYKLDDDNEINVLVKDETIWLTQKAMAELFSCSPDNISLHLKNIYESGELIEGGTTEKISAVQKEGNRSVSRVKNMMSNHFFIFTAWSFISGIASPELLRIFAGQ